jgi:adenosylmethionine-8-amino-7-oxononanoate aminotransferase
MKAVVSQSLNERDKQVIWHPFTQHGIETDFLPVKSAKGAWLTLEDDTKILDAISSWWVNLHGHAHPEIAKAIFDQADTLEHTMFAGFTHEPGVKLAETLVQAAQIKGAPLTRCFYTDNGSTAVEAAMKMSYQYHKVCGRQDRKRFLALSNAYHGDTIGCMSVSARGSYHRFFADLLVEVDFVDSPQTLKAMLEAHPDQYAAFIIEPMVQGAGGMLMHSAEFLAEIGELCKKAGVLLIADEIFTGFYRTGKLFAFEHANIQPDMLCLSKGLTGGALPLSVTLTSHEIFEAYCSEDVGKAFLHGHSFTANPIGCAAALASWRILHRPETQANIQRIAEQTKQWLARLSEHPKAENARTLGTIGAIDIKGYPSYFSAMSYKIRSFALQNNVLIRPLGSVLYAVPPYCATAEEIDKIYATIALILDNAEN